MKATVLLVGGSAGKRAPRNEITPPEALRRVERGADIEMIPGSASKDKPHDGSPARASNSVNA